MLNFLKKTLAVQGEELSSLLWMFVFGSFLGVSVSLYDVASVTDFLEVYNHTYLPGAIICSGLLGIFTANTFISIQNWVSYSKVACWTIVILLLLILSICISHLSSASEASVYISFVLIGPISSLTLLVFWGLFERLFDLAQVRRLSAIAESGMVVAAISSLAFIALTNDSYYDLPVNLYIISFYHLVFALITLLIISYKKSFLRKVVINVQYIKAYNNYRRLIKQRYIILLGLFSLFSAISFYLTDYTYLVFVDQQYTTAASTMDFLAGFSSAMIALGFVLQISIVKWVNEKYGYLVSLLVLPSLLGLFTIIYGILGSVEGYDPENTVFFFLFMLVCISKLISVSLFRSLEFSTYKFFFMPLDNLLRADLQSKVERVMREVGKCLAGLMAVLIIHYLTIEYFPYILLAVLGIWCFVTVKINIAYRDKLKISLDEPEEIEKKERVADSIIDELIKIIPETKGREVQAYLSLLKILDPVVYKSCILNLLENDNEEIQKIALLETSKLCLLPAIPILQTIQHSKYYPVLKTRDLIDKVYAQLKAAEFRLEKVKYIEQLTLSKLHRERVFGALLAAYAEDSMKPRLLNKLFRDTHSKVRYSAVTSSAYSTNVDIEKNLIEKFADSFYSNAAVSAITATGEDVFSSMENAFYLTGQEEKIQMRIVQAYGRIGTEKAVQLLLKKLNYTNQNVNRAAFEALSQCGYTIGGERVIQFKAELEEYVNVLVWNMSAYLDLQNKETSEVLLQAMLSEIESNYNSIFKLLTLLYDPKTIALIKENIFSSDAEKSEYAFGLAEVTLADELKPFLLPVLTNLSFDAKLKKMQEYFPTEPMPKVDVLYDLVQRDYKYVNRWTKACALKELAEQKETIDNDIFIANVINPDTLLKETAAVALYMKAPDLFPPTFERFQRDLGASYSKEVVNKIKVSDGSAITSPAKIETEEVPVYEASLSDKADYFTAPNLKFEFIKFLNGIEDFKYVPGIVLMELAKVSEFFRFKAGATIAVYENQDDLDYFLVRSGKVTICKDDTLISTHKERSFIHNYYLMSLDEERIKMLAETDCEVYKIKQDEFNEVMSFFNEIPWSLVKNIRSGHSKTKLK